VRIITAVIIITLVASGNVLASAGLPDSDQVHRVVTNIGVGRYVAVTFSSGETLRGYIKAIADDHFALLVDGWPAPGDIPYRDVQWVGPVPQLVLRARGPSLSKIETIVSAVAFGSFLVTAFVECHNKSC
jgi:hypothetical protein